MAFISFFLLELIWVVHLYAIIAHGQADMVASLQEDPRTSEEEHFRIVLIQTEAERVKFLVRSYLRTRLYKVGRPTSPLAIAGLLKAGTSQKDREILGAYYHEP